jgi:hypothetical protein
MPFFKGEPEDFGNTYHYQVGDLNGFEAPVLANIIRAAEQSISASDVEFLDWQMWGPVDGPEAENVIFASGEWDNQTGDGVSAIGQYPTVALLFRWPLPRSPVENRKRWCFKYFRGFDPGRLGADEARALARIPDETRDELYSDYGSVVANPELADFQLDLCSPLDGATITGQGQLKPYTVTRQIAK